MGQNKKPREAVVEKKLVKGIRAEGGIAFKWVAPGFTGVPDRIVILPGGKIIFVELKTETGHLSYRQKLVIHLLYRLGCDVRVLYGMSDVEGFINEVRAMGLPKVCDPMDQGEAV